MAEELHWRAPLNLLCGVMTPGGGPRHMPASYDHAVGRLKTWVPAEARLDVATAIAALLRLLPVSGTNTAGFRARAIDSLLREAGYDDIPSYTIDQTSQAPH